MFAGVAERLDPVEDAGGRVGDRRQADPLGERDERLGQKQPAPAARQHDPQRFVGGAHAGRREQAVGVGAHGLQIERQAEVAGRALEPREVLLQRERGTVVDADHLEHPIAADQAVVGGGDRRLGGGHDRAVERREGLVRAMRRID